MALNSEQQKVLGKLIRRGRRAGATRKEIKAAVETGLVESNLRNLHHGDADSQGWRQERASLYKNPTNLNASIDRFYKETRAVRNKYGKAGDLAAAVQRPAAQYRGRYDQNSSKAEQLLRRHGRGAGATATTARSGGGRAGRPGRTVQGADTQIVTKNPGTDNSAARMQLVQSFLSDRKADPVDFAIGMKGLKDVAASSSTQRIPGQDWKVPGRGGRAGGRRTSGGGGGGGGGDLATRSMRRARIINRQKLPYSWGGGHAGKTPIRKAVALDCSGAVSKVLGINPRVADQFKGWGRPGDSGSRGVTIYSKPDHVLMKINGHFFGTSRANPGGGAGWIPQSSVSREYLSQFTARHA